jgi:hypothetical protein
VSGAGAGAGAFWGAAAPLAQPLPADATPVVRTFARLLRDRADAEAGAAPARRGAQGVLCVAVDAENDDAVRHAVLCCVQYAETGRCDTSHPGCGVVCAALPEWCDGAAVRARVPVAGDCEAVRSARRADMRVLVFLCGRERPGSALFASKCVLAEIAPAQKGAPHRFEDAGCVFEVQCVDAGVELTVRLPAGA